MMHRVRGVQTTRSQQEFEQHERTSEEDKKKSAKYKRKGLQDVPFHRTFSKDGNFSFGGLRIHGFTDSCPSP